MILKDLKNDESSGPWRFTSCPKFPYQEPGCQLIDDRNQLKVMDFASILGILSGLFLIIAAIFMKGILPISIRNTPLSCLYPWSTRRFPGLWELSIFPKKPITVYLSIWPRSIERGYTFLFWKGKRRNWEKRKRPHLPSKAAYSRHKRSPFTKAHRDRALGRRRFTGYSDICHIHDTLISFFLTDGGWLLTTEPHGAF